MTLAEIETALLQIQEKLNANTAAITSINNTLSNYATTDDLESISEQINVLIDNNSTLQNAVATLDTSVKKIDHLNSLNDVKIGGNHALTENDVLLYGNDGKWHNVQISSIVKQNDQTADIKLSALTDVLISSPTDGQSLVYDGASNRWMNKMVSSGSGSDDYLTESRANQLYLKLTGGTVDWLTVKGLTTLQDNLLVYEGITMHKS